MKITWTKEAWTDYLYWQQQDKKKLQKINELIRDIQRVPFQGLAKAEPLKGNLNGKWSRRIDYHHRLIYSFVDNCLVIFQCRYHYS